MGKIKKIRDILVISIAIAAFIVLAGKIVPFKDLNASIDPQAGKTEGDPLDTETSPTVNNGEFRLDLSIDEGLFRPVNDIFTVSASSGDTDEQEPAVDEESETPDVSAENNDEGQEPELPDTQAASEDTEETAGEDREDITVSAVPDEEAIDYNNSEDFRIEVDLERQRLIVFHKDGLLREMVCSGGAPESPTPLGEFITSQKIEYAWVERFGVGAYYWIRFFEDYLIHSVPFDENGEMILEEYVKLGNPASHGCIRLKLDEAKWLYETLPLGVKVLIY